MRKARYRTVRCGLGELGRVSGCCVAGRPVAAGRGAERLLGQGSRLGPGVHERGEGFPVGDLDQHPAHPDPDLAPLRSGQRVEDLDVNLLGACDKGLGGNMRRAHRVRDGPWVPQGFPACSD
jgi:hypothetical protein